MRDIIVMRYEDDLKKFMEVCEDPEENWNLLMDCDGEEYYSECDGISRFKLYNRRIDEAFYFDGILTDEWNIFIKEFGMIGKFFDIPRPFNELPYEVLSVARKSISQVKDFAVNGGLNLDFYDFFLIRHGIDIDDYTENIITSVIIACTIIEVDPLVVFNRVKLLTTPNGVALCDEKGDEKWLLEHGFYLNNFQHTFKSVIYRLVGIFDRMYVQ